MKVSSLDHFQCPECLPVHSSLKLKSEQIQVQEVLEGDLICKRCGSCFPIQFGIPRFISSENYGKSFGKQWNLHPKTQLDSYTRFSISHDRLFSVTGWQKLLKGQKILEAGSGAGRFTEILLKTGANVFSFDLSAAVEANWANNHLQPNLNLFQGNISKLPLPKGSFEKVLCLGVIQHTPDPKGVFMSLAQFVRPGGELVVDVYTKSLTSLLQWKYLLRPVTKRIDEENLYRIIEWIVPKLLPVARFLKRVGGKFGARLMPIVEYSDLGLPADLNLKWAILDTFDMYSPVHDHPQTIKTVQKWFEEAGFKDIKVRYGPNGIIGKGRRGPDDKLFSKERRD